MNENILNIEFWKHVDDVKTVVGITQTAAGQCRISSGDGSIKEGYSCNVVDDGSGNESISFVFTVTIKDPTEYIQTFTLTAEDYFGNSYMISHSF